MDNQAPRKFDHGKPQVNLIPTVAIVEIGKVLAFGAQKYDRGNWAKGLATSRYYDAAMRHLLAWNGGEDNDPESGLSHLAHAGCNLCFMLWNMLFRKDLDDRWHTQYKTPAQLTVEPFWAWFYGGDKLACSPVYVSREVAQKWSHDHKENPLIDATAFVLLPATKDGERR